MRDEGKDIVGLKMDLMMDGKLNGVIVHVCSACIVHFIPSQDGQHCKIGDTRPRIKERMVRFGDSPQVEI